MRWVLDLDADLELMDPSARAPSTRRRAKTAALGRTFLAGANATAPAGVVHVAVPAAAAPGAAPGAAPADPKHLSAAPAAGSVTQAWSPTPGAQLAWPDLGPAPPLEVLQRVNHRAFAAALQPGLDSCLPGAAFVSDLAAFDRCLATAAPPGGWLLKRPFGFSGRGRKHVGGTLTDRDRRWVEASMTQYGGGLQVEPFVAIEAEFAQHGWVSRDGSWLAGRPTRAHSDPAGAWRASAVAGASALSAAEVARLRAALDAVAAALASVGYFGPFGIDAFRWRAAGTSRFRALSEINARYTMGYFAGMTGRQPEWLARIRGDRREVPVRFGGAGRR